VKQCKVVTCHVGDDLQEGCTHERARQEISRRVTEMEDR